MRTMYYSVMTQANSEKRNSECSYQESNLTINRKVIGSTPDRSTPNFFFPSLPVSLLNNTSFSKVMLFQGNAGYVVSIHTMISSQLAS